MVPKGPGINIIHSTLPKRAGGVVRCDVAAILGFMPREHWPEGAKPGDFVVLELHRAAELLDHPRRRLFDAPSQQAARCFFENGGLICHLFSVCLESPADLRDGAVVLSDLLDRLRVEEELGLLACPAAAYWPCRINHLGRVESDADPLYDVLLGHCLEMTSRFLVLDAPRGLHGQALEGWVEALRERDKPSRSFGAIYYPWIRKGEDLIPPSGAVLGAFAKTEREHEPYGVVWSPANISLAGVGNPEIRLDWMEARELASAGINPLVLQPRRGLVIFGARTLSKRKEWEFINSRRVVSMIAEQLRRDNEWAVFEPNDKELWRLLERDIDFRLSEFWEKGVLAGQRAGEEYWVRCDAETNGRSDRENGMVNVLVRLRPVTTTEQISIELVLGDRTEVRTGGS